MGGAGAYIFMQSPFELIITNIFKITKTAAGNVNKHNHLIVFSYRVSHSLLMGNDTAPSGQPLCNTNHAIKNSVP
jgi:hypothetical protein